MSMNKVILIGHLGADPEVRYTQGGDAVCNLRLATNERYRDRDGNWTDRTEWHRVVVFGNQAEHCREYLRKGRLVSVEGSLQTREWQDNAGQRRFSTEVKAFRVDFLGGREGGGGGGGGGPKAGSGGGGVPGDDGLYDAPPGGGGTNGGTKDGGTKDGGGGGGDDPGFDDDIPF